MRIGFDAKRAFFNNTGLGNYSRDTIRILSNIYDKNSYFLFTPKDSHNKHLSLLKERNNISVNTPNSIINKCLRSYWRTKTITKDLQKNNIDIYHGLSNELPLGIENTNIKTVVTIHDLIFMRYPNLFNTIDRKIYIRKVRSSCSKSNQIIAVSKQTKQDIIDFLGISSDKITVVYQGCNTIFQSQIPNNKRKESLSKYNLPNKFLLYVGTIEERKNLLTLLKTLLDMPDQNLVVIGNGKRYKRKCIQYIKENNLSKQVTLLDNVSSLYEMASIYQSAQMMIFPSLFEGFGIPILESLFSKTPVITSKYGCFSEAGGPGSKYIDPLSTHEMKSAIINIQGNLKIAEEMQTIGFQYAQNFTDEKIAEDLIQVYKNL